MVNCKNCGAPLSLENAVCPHCGTPNPEAIEHLKKLSQLNKDFKKAKIEVAGEVQKSKQGYGALIILVLVLIANLVLFVMHGASYSIAERIRASRYDKAQIGEELERSLAEKDYDRLTIFQDSFDVRYSDFPKYNGVAYLAYDYLQIKKEVTDYLNSSDYYSDPLVRSIRSIKVFKDEYERLAKRRNEEELADQIDELNERCDLFLKTFLKMNDDDIAQVTSLSESQLLVLVSGRLNDEE